MFAREYAYGQEIKGSDGERKPEREDEMYHSESHGRNNDSAIMR